MKFKVLIGSFLIVIGLNHASFAADIVAPKPPETIPVLLTADEIGTVAASLNIAAGTCVQSPDGCVVGFQKPPILAKLQAAISVLQKKSK
jgi:hypothetical protein